MKTKFKFLIIGLLAFFSIEVVNAQITSQNFKVYGNCGMCKKTIEKVALQQGAKKALWNEDSKKLTVQFDAKKSNADKILKGIAYAGYDNEKYLAPTEAYEDLADCCKYKRSDLKLPEATKQTKFDQTTSEKINVDTQTKLEEVYSTYFDLKDALVKSDAKAAAEKASQLSDVLNAINMTAMTTAEHSAYMKHEKILKTKSETIAKAKDLKKQREEFSKLSDAVFALMKTGKPAYPVYFDNCPMYNEGKGANWISKEIAIKNPYYGAQMMTCGSVKETIK